MTALPPVVDATTWQRDLRRAARQGAAATRELDAIASACAKGCRMVGCRTTPWRVKAGRSRLADVFEGKSQLIVYSHMWFPGEEWQCPGCTGFTAQYTRLEFLDDYDARFVIVTQGPIDEALAYKRRTGNKMTWYSTANSPFGSDVGAPPGGGFAVNVFLRDGDTVYRTWHTNGRGHRAAHPHLPADRPAALRPDGGVAGLAGGLAEGAPPTAAGAPVPGRRRRLRPGRLRRLRAGRAERAPVPGCSLAARPWGAGSAAGIPSRLGRSGADAAGMRARGAPS